MRVRNKEKKMLKRCQYILIDGAASIADWLFILFARQKDQNIAPCACMKEIYLCYELFIYSLGRLSTHQKIFDDKKNLRLFSGTAKWGFELWRS